MNANIKEEASKNVSKPLHVPNKKSVKEDMDFLKLLDNFEKLEGNVPFAQALAEMPKYAEFLKNLVATKKKLGEVE